MLRNNHNHNAFCLLNTNTNMGNCLIRGMGDANKSVIRVTTSQGGVMEFHQPISVESITDEFPGHGIYPSHGLFWKPLPHYELLVSGESYHLLPLLGDNRGLRVPRLEHVRSNTVPQQSTLASYRMSFNSRGLTKKRLPDDEVSKNAYGIWKVKLVIGQKQLMEILSEEERTEELIESVRTVAKCGSVGGGSSDRWSRSSSRNAPSSNKDVLLDS